MIRRLFNRFLVKSILGLTALTVLPAMAADEAPDVFVTRLTTQALDAVKADKAIQGGDISRTIALVDTMIMPHVNFQRMTAFSVGPAWRQATPEQKKRLQDEFKTLLVRTYAGALAQVNDVSFNVKPMRYSPDDKEVIVRTLVKGRGDPIQLDYRLEKTPGVGDGWKIYNLNVLGVWLADTYRSQFAQEISTSGIDGLISALAERNKANKKKV